MLSDTRINWKKNSGFNDYELNAGLRYMTDTYQSEYAVGHNTGSDQVKEMSNSLSYKSAGGIEEPYKLLTYYGVFNYGLRDKYFIEAAMNTETNSRFGKEAKNGIKLLGVSWAVFPSLNALMVYLFFSGQ